MQAHGGYGADQCRSDVTKVVELEGLTTVFWRVQADKNDRACVDGARELENHFDTSGAYDQVEMKDVQAEVKPVGMRMMVQLEG
ncbi:unnamed protein product [Leuciscus chuanchicus]